VTAWEIVVELAQGYCVGFTLGFSLLMLRGWELRP
jgi:hypothetical protein